MTAAVAAPPFELTSLAPPLTIWEDGSVRIGRTRVQLGHVVDLYNYGVTPEEIVERTPVLTIEAVYGTIAFYLAHRAEIDPWLEERNATAMKLLAELEARPESLAWRARAQALKASQSAAAHG